MLSRSHAFSAVGSRSAFWSQTRKVSLANRSALEWVIDQYRVTRDDQGKIVSDPNRLDDEQYIVRLIGQVITVSLETQKLVAGLPPVAFD